MPEKDKMKSEHIVTGFVLFAVLVTLIITSYSAILTDYGLTKGDVDADGDNVMDKLNNLTIIFGINQTVTGVYKITNPTSSVFDILGALASAGIGVLKIVAGVLLLPVDILGVITGFYYIPPIINIGVGIIFTIYIGFILLKNYTRT